MYVCVPWYSFLQTHLACASLGPLCSDFALVPNAAYFLSFLVLVCLPSTKTSRTGCSYLLMSSSVDLTWGWRKGSKLQSMNRCIGQNSGGPTFSVSSQIHVNVLSIHCIHSLTSPPLPGASASSPNPAQHRAGRPVRIALPVSADSTQSSPFRLEFSRSPQDFLGENISSSGRTVGNCAMLSMNLLHLSFTVRFQN